MAPRRVAITGVGLVSCLGHDYGQVVRALQNGVSGIRAMPEWENLGLKSRVAGTILDIEAKFECSPIPKKLRPAISEASKYCCLAALDAVGDSGLSEVDVRSDRTACIVGTGIGSVESIYTAGRQLNSGEIAKLSPLVVLKSMASASSAAVANLLKVHGRSYSISSACSTSSHSIGTAYELIRYGIVDRAIAGGGEEVHPLIAAGFQALRFALATKFNECPQRASRPYDVARDGFVIGGGAGIVVLEAWDQALARRARVRAEIVGFGTSSDGFDMVMPEPTGMHAAKSMRNAIEGSGMSPRDVGAVNTHGTATAKGDVAEVEAMKEVFDGKPPPFSSTKSMTGHPLGAAGALETIFCIGMLEHRFIAPSINVEKLDPEFAGLPVVTTPKFGELDTILSNSFGFGGTNASLLLKAFRN
ncbi:MAG: beta-ketoacyl-[acyl-carrier-protein] synthase family protein [Betaproteobacteria bacterium]|nr:MAG: beta-ketoacyl-[acyl-carrier-protein] synthase family protein [Betaproteobacteria bacterium]